MDRVDVHAVGGGRRGGGPGERYGGRDEKRLETVIARPGVKADARGGLQIADADDGGGLAGRGRDVPRRRKCGGHCVGGGFGLAPALGGLRAQEELFAAASVFCCRP